MAEAERMRGLSEAMVIGWSWAATYQVHEIAYPVPGEFSWYGGFHGDTAEGRRAITFACRFLK